MGENGKFGQYAQEWTAEEQELMEAQKAALEAEDSIRIRMAALSCAAEVTRGTAAAEHVNTNDAAGVLLLADKFERYLKTGELA